MAYSGWDIRRFRDASGLYFADATKQFKTDGVQYKTAGYHTEQALEAVLDSRLSSHDKCRK